MTTSATWLEWEFLPTTLAGLEIIRNNRGAINTAGVGGCAVAVTRCIGAVLGFCFCVMDPQVVAYTASSLLAGIGSFFGATFTAAMYECDAIGFQGLTANDVRKEYNECFGKKPEECHTKECARRNGHGRVYY
ncbi:hypothetical protein EDD21DRAFT_357803 [Dissophora ornata]|nr:hypothetical protein EDD21DRAFT_357803 [Dissophora ornata]